MKEKFKQWIKHLEREVGQSRKKITAQGGLNKALGGIRQYEQ